VVLLESTLKNGEGAEHGVTAVLQRVQLAQRAAGHLPSEAALLTWLQDVACSYTTWYTAQASLKRSMRSRGLYSNSSALYSICRIPQEKKNMPALRAAFEL